MYNHLNVARRISGNVSVAHSGSVVVQEALETLSSAEPGNIQQIAASQLKILDGYYNTALHQAQKSFETARLLAITGVVFFIVTALIVIWRESSNITLIGILAGTTVEAVSGLVFWLYGRTAAQLVHFHERLERSQRFLLANSFCEALNDDTKESSRANLIATMIDRNHDSRP